MLIELLTKILLNGEWPKATSAASPNVLISKINTKQ